MREIIANSAAEGQNWNASYLDLSVRDWVMHHGPPGKKTDKRKALFAIDDGKGVCFGDSSRLATVGMSTYRQKRFGLNNMGFQQAACTLGDGVVILSRTLNPAGEICRQLLR